MAQKWISLLKIIDAHVHLGIKNMPEYCYEFVSRTGLNSLYIDQKSLKLSDDEIEIEKIILIPSYTCGSNSCIDGFYDQIEWRRGFEDKFLIFATVNPNCEIKVKEELERQYSLGAVGIKLHPVHHYFKPNDYRAEERSLKNLALIYEFAEAYDLPIMIHTGTSIAPKSRNKFGNPIYIEDVIKDYKIKVIISHIGRPIWNNIALYLAKTYHNVYIEISSIPLQNINNYIPNLKEFSHKIIYGSDFPQYKGHDLLINAKDAAQCFESNEDILRNNILKLIKI